MTAVFIGHADYTEQRNTELKKCILSLIEKGGAEFWCGGMGGFDRAAAGCVRQRKGLRYVEQNIIPF